MVASIGLGGLKQMIFSNSSVACAIEPDKELDSLEKSHSLRIHLLQVQMLAVDHSVQSD